MRHQVFGGLTIQNETRRDSKMTMSGIHTKYFHLPKFPKNFEFFVLILE